MSWAAANGAAQGRRERSYLVVGARGDATAQPTNRTPANTLTSRCAGVWIGHLARLRLLLGRLADPGHHCPQLGADLLDLVVGRAAAQRLELRPAGRLLGDDVAGETTLLDVAEQAAHLLADVLVDHDRAG